MKKIEEVFFKLKKEKKKALIPYITAGDPTLEKTMEVLKIFAENGADLIELGVPFSDPMADGPVIQNAMDRALKSGTTLKKVLQLVTAFKKDYTIPIILMGYCNPFFAYNFEKFAMHAQSAGVDGVLIVDLPPEESKEFNQKLKKHNLTQIFLATPLTDEKRISYIKHFAKGFIYFVSVTGVTGERTSLPKETSEKLKAIKLYSRLPVVLGFGISGPEIIKDYYDVADGFVVGSALVKRWEEAAHNKTKESDFIEFFKSLSEVCHGK